MQTGSNSILDYQGTEIGNYRIIAEIDSGGMGTVFLTEHIILTDRQAAIKLLHAHLNTPEDQKHFLHEARLLEKLKHPNILPIYDVGFHQNRPYIITEYASGGSLRDLLQQNHQHLLPWDNVLTILQQVGQALQYAHNQEIVHRDLKPENILFHADGHVLLADFGIAMEIKETSTHDQTVVGSVDYMAPEQFKRLICKEIDQYALGCIAYELATGRVPFQAEDIPSLINMHIKRPPDSLIALNPTLSPIIEQTIFKALAKERADRFPTINDFLDALSAAPRPDQQAVIITTSTKITSGKTVQQWVQVGIQQLKENHPKKALDAFDAALLADPSCGDALIGKAKAHYKLQHTKKAMDVVEQILCHDPNHIEALSHKGHLLARQYRHSAALSAYDKVLSLSPNIADIHVQCAKQLYYLKRYREALEAYEKALSLGIADTQDNFIGLGDTFFQLQQYDEALNAYERILKTFPRNIPCLFKKANTLRMLKRYKDALSHYEKLLKLSHLPSTTKTDCLYGKADTLRYLERYAEALTAINSCARSRRDFDVFFLKGCILFSLKQYKDAFNMFQEALKQNKNNIATLYNIAACFFNVGQYQDALEQCNVILSRKPDYALGWQMQGDVLRKLEKHEEAVKAYEETVKVYEEAIKIKPYEPEPFVSKARCLKNLQRYEESLEAYERYLVLEPQAVSIFIEKGDILIILERYLQAFYAYQKAYQLEQKESYWSKILQVIRKMEDTAQKDAFKSYAVLVKQGTVSAELHRQKANFHLRLEQYEQALAEYVSALQLNPQDGLAASGKTAAQKRINEVARLKEIQEQQTRASLKAEQTVENPAEKQQVPQSFPVHSQEIPLSAETVPPSNEAIVVDSTNQPLPSSIDSQTNVNPSTSSLKQQEKRLTWWNRIFKKSN